MQVSVAVLVAVLAVSALVMQVLVEMLVAVLTLSKGWFLLKDCKRLQPS